MSPQQFRRIGDIFDHAASLPADKRQSYVEEACAGDAELRRHVEEMLASDDALSGDGLSRVVTDAEETLRSHTSPVGRQVGPYKIIREIGRGGMGAVYQAVRADQPYIQSVAIKFIAVGMDTDEALARFRVERQVLAALQHPNIATLLDGGTSSEGRPYIVMEYIEGQPLIDYARQNDLTIRQRLDLFCAICSAVHHAHQMLVIHRDIKPANVLVTADGVPKLLDFGIAKFLAPELLQGDAPQTLTRMRRLTPQYASPEQIRGEHVTTASDVYSLGVLLYELLTYASPYQTAGHSVAQIERAVCEGDALRLTRAPGMTPRQRREFAGDLDNIVAMALRKEPQRRYSSAQELSSDIRRYLDGLPVAAREDTLFYLAGKLVRRNKLASTAFALLALSVAAGWTATIHQARRTQERFEEVRRLANTLLRDIPRDLRNVPGTGPIRTRLVTTALEYLNSLSKDAGGDFALQYDLAAAWDLVGDAQGDPEGPSLGKYSEAIASYTKAAGLTREVQRVRSDWDVLNRLTWLHYKIGDLRWRSGESPEAFDNYNEGLRYAAAARDGLKDPRGYNLEREGRQRVARSLLASRRLIDALTSATQAVEAAQRYLQLVPGPRASNTVGTALMIQGDVLGVLGRMEDSRRAYEEAVKRLERGVAIDTYNIPVLEDLADAYRRVGDVLAAPIYFHFGRPEEASVFLQKALDLEKQMTAHDPQSAQRQARLSLACRRLASVVRYTDPATAAALYEQAIGILSGLASSYPADLNYERELANHRSAYAVALGGTRRIDDAIRQLDQAIAVQRRLVEKVPKRTVLQEDLFHSLLALGELRLRNGNAEQALTSAAEARAVANRLVQRDASSLYAHRCLALASSTLGDVYARTRRADLALGSYREALQTWSQWVRDGTALPYSTAREREVLERIQRLTR